MTDPVMLIFTVEGEDLILSHGWSGSWKVNQWRAKKYKYIILCQNLNKSHAEEAEWDFATATKPHGTGFMLARLDGVVPSPDHEGRWNFKLGDFVRIDLQNLWKGWRFPINYEHNLQDFGLNPNTLQFEPMPPPVVVEASDPAQPVLSEQVAETKAISTSDSALADIAKYAANRLGVRSDEVEITITLLPRQRACLQP